MVRFFNNINNCEYSLTNYTLRILFVNFISCLGQVHDYGTKKFYIESEKSNLDKFWKEIVQNIYYFLLKIFHALAVTEPEIYNNRGGNNSSKYS